MAEKLFRERRGNVIVETGCSWFLPQGNSTYHLARLAHETGSVFFSIDTNADHIAAARAMISEFPTASIIQDDGVAHLSRWETAIDYLYLDSFDHDVKSPLAAKMHSLAELGAAYGKLSDRAVVLLDDWNWGRFEPGQDWLKPSYSREFLLYRGWKLVIEDYQLLFTR